MAKVYNFEVSLEWSLIALLSDLDRFDASWSSVEKKEGASLKELKKIATVRSVGASTRIEGSKLNNEQVDHLLQNLSIDKLTDRDRQEVVGYFDALDTISNAFKEITITEGDIKNLHKLLLQHSEKDQWHRGNYKTHSNSVEATLVDGTKQLIFETTPPGFETEEAMRNLCAWYRTDKLTHPLVKSALFSYEFVSIHPFQDGNGRLSRLLATLSLLKNGYNWIQYVSFEHEIEHRKVEYYRQLRICQANRPNENVSSWLQFFFNALKKIQHQLMDKLEQSGAESTLSTKQRTLLLFISEHPGTQSGQIAKRLEIPNPSVKKLLRELTEMGLIQKSGVGRGTSYRST